MPAQIGTFAALQAVNDVAGSVVPVSSALITGSASAGGATSVTGTGFTANALVGLTVWISSGTGAGSWAVITANTTTVITVTAWLGAGVSPASGSTYNVGPTWKPGMTWWNTTSSQFYIWNSTAWIPAPPQNGISTTVATTVLTDSTRTWIASQWVGYTVAIISGTGVGSTGVITASTSTSVTVSSWSGTQPTTGCGYAICNRYLALLTYDPTLEPVVNLSDAGFIEYPLLINSVSTAYARQPVTFNAVTSGYPSLVANTNVITFGPFAQTMPNPVSWLALVTVPSGSTGYYLGNWYSPTPMQVALSQSIQIGIGELVLQDQ